MGALRCCQKGDPHFRAVGRCTALHSAVQFPTARQCGSKNQELLMHTLSQISTKHDISKIMDQLASEEDTDIESEDETDVSISNVQTSATSAAPPKTVLLPPALTDIEEAPHPLLLSQCENSRGLKNVSISADYPRIASANRPPSHRPLLPHSSRPKKRPWNP